MTEERLAYTIVALVAWLIGTGLAYYAGFRHGYDARRQLEFRERKKP